MSTSDYWSLLKDCRLASKGFGDKKSARLDLIFSKCNQRIGLPDETEHNPDKELIPRQYIEALVRIAVLQYEHRSPQVPLSVALQRLLEHYVLPHGVQSNTEEFREELASDEVRAVFTSHRIQLQRVFLYVCDLLCGVPHPVQVGCMYVCVCFGCACVIGCGAPGVRLTSCWWCVAGCCRFYASNGMSLKINDFIKLLKDCQLMDKGALSPLAVKHLFAHTQLEETFADDTSVGGGEDDMVYSEFLEGLAAVSMTKICTPYITTPKRFVGV